jgi:hypothetical protein
MGDLTGCVPGGAGSQFCLFQQNNIVPTLMRQMVGQSTAHNASANDYDAGRCGKIIAHEKLRLKVLDKLIKQMYFRQS